MSLFTNNKDNKNLFFCAHFYCKTANFRSEYLKSSNYLGMMIFVTETKTGTMVKHVPQEQMVDFRSYPSRELFSPLFRVCHVTVV